MTESFRAMAVLALFLLPLALFAGEPDSLTRDTVTLASDSTPAPVDSAAAETEAQESSFQDDVDALFRLDSTEIDTAQWDTGKINAARFDYREMKDTVSLLLVDPIEGRFYVHPVQGEVTSPFGLRRFFWHFGTDVRLKRGDTIHCAFDGMVRVIQNDRYGYGKVAVVRHASGLETLYGHLSKCMIRVRMWLKAGDPVGLGGRTGRSTGPHLHFEIRYRGEPFDPALIIDFENGVLKNDMLRLCRENFEYLAEARSTIVHVIRKGDMLGKIARRYGTTVRKLCAFNGIRSTTLLRIGRKLVIRRGPF